MAFTDKPTYIPEWASTDVYNEETETYNVVAPDDAKKELGWDAYEKPPRNYMNWLQRGNYLWINYFNQFFGDSHELLVDVIEPNGASGVTILTSNVERLRLAASTPQITVANNARDLVDSSGYVVADKQRETGSASGVLNTKIIEIGDWNMDSTENVSVSHELTLSKIRMITVTIMTDTSIRHSLNQSGYWTCSTEVVTLHRTTSGEFDSTDYNSTPFNRGWIKIEYVD